MVCGVSRELLELVGGPVAEIERARRSGLKCVPAQTDLPHVQFGGALDQFTHMPGREPRERLGVAFDPDEEGAVADERYLDRLRHPGALLARRQSVDEG